MATIMLEVARPDVVPGPQGSRLLGMTRQLQRDPLGTFERAMIEYGGVARLVVGPPGLRQPLHLVSHPDYVAHVLVGGSNGYTKGTPAFKELAAYFGDGLLTSEGADWRRQRRMVAPLFTKRRIAGYVTVMAEEAAELAGRWVTQPSTRVDLHAELTEYTLRVVGRALFGTSFDDAIPVVRRVFPIINEHAFRRALNPLRLPRSWPTPAERRVVRARRELYAVVDGIIERRRRATGGGEDGDDFVSMLLAARDPETGAALTSQEVRDQVLIFLLAGHETTAIALTFAGDLLGRHPEVQRRVHRELDAVLGGALPTAQDLAKLSETAMVVKEALRLYPPAPTTDRLSRNGDHIGGYPIPPGSRVIVSPWVVHRHPDFWLNPGEFDPQRFRPEAERARHRHAYLPFGSGPRVCIGQHFAMAEAIVAIAVLLSRCTLRSDPSPPSLALAFTVRPAGTVPCEITPAIPSY